MFLLYFLSFIQTLNGVHILFSIILFSSHIVKTVYVFRVFVIVTQCNNLMAENKIITTTSDSCNPTVSDLYDGKSKNKIAVVFFS